MEVEGTERMVELLLAIALATALPIAVGMVGRDVGAIGRPGALPPAAPLVAGLAVAVGLLVERGWLGAALVAPWVAVAGVIAVATMTRSVRLVREDSAAAALPTLGLLVPVGFLIVGVTWLGFDRLGIRPIGFPTVIVLLTAVHFHVAGFFLTLAGLTVLRARTTRAIRGRTGRALVAAVLAVAVGAPLTAFAFLGVAFVGWIGALLVAVGGIGIGLGQIQTAFREAAGATRSGLRSAGLLVGGATLLITMPLAAAYATGTTFGIPFLDVPAMAAIHGTLNVLAFAIPTAVGWRTAASRTTGPAAGPAPAATPPQSARTAE